MGRHRDTGAGTHPVPVTPGGEVRSHRRPPGVARARAISLVAVGALAGGVAVASTAPWSREASNLQPDVGPGEPSGATGGEPGVLPVPPATEAPASPVAAPATAETVTPPPEVWRADEPGAFMATSWNTVGAPPPRVDGDGVAFQLTGRGQRSELEPALPTVHDGDEHDLTFSVRLDGTFAESPGARQVIARWENDSPGPAPLDLRVDGGRLVLHGGEGHPSGPRTFTRTLGRAPVGEWTQLRVLVRFSADPDKGSVSVWRDGRPVLDDVHPRGGTLYPGQQSYLKVGLHRDRTIATPSAVRFGGWRIDHGRAAAVPDRESPDRESPDRESPDREGPDRESPDRGSQDRDATSSVRASTERSDDGPSRSASTSDRRASERSARDEPARHTSSRRPPSAGDRSGRDESTGSARSGTSRPRTSPASSRDDAGDDDAPRNRTTPSDMSTDSRSARDGATGERRTTTRDASEDADARRDTSREGSSTDGGDDPGERSREK